MSGRFEVADTALARAPRLQRQPREDERGWLERMFCADDLADVVGSATDRAGEPHPARGRRHSARDALPGPAIGRGEDRELPARRDLRRRCRPPRGLADVPPLAWEVLSAENRRRSSSRRDSPTASRLWPTTPRFCTSRPRPTTRRPNAACSRRIRGWGSSGRSLLEALGTRRVPPAHRRRRIRRRRPVSSSGDESGGHRGDRVHRSTCRGGTRKTRDLADARQSARTYLGPPEIRSSRWILRIRRSMPLIGWSPRRPDPSRLGRTPELPPRTISPSELPAQIRSSR